MKRILLVEDDPVINQNIRESLEMENFTVFTVFDGFMAEKMLRKDDFDCVILDLNLPHKNGYALCREFRQYNQTTPLLILTAFDELEDKVEGYESGADDYLTKPFYMKELLLRIQSLLKRNNSSQHPKNKEETLVADDVTINQSARQVWRQGQEVILTPREYQILVHLVKANGAMVAKKDLIREIWGTSLDVNTNTIEVYINFLRKKLDKPFNKDSIRTKIGFGYYFAMK